MIDYEKLKLAHNLILKVDEKYVLALYVSCSFDPYFRLGTLNTDWFEDYNNIDDLIKKLKELTEPKRAHKYIVGDEVWFLRVCGTIDHSYVVEIDFDSNDMYLINGVRWFEEKDLYPTKQALIESQVAYWQSLLEAENKKIEAAHYLAKLAVQNTGFNDYIPKEKECPNCHQLIFTDPCPCSLKAAPIPYHRCPHGVMCYETENVRMYCEICGNKPDKECQHESDRESFVKDNGVPPGLTDCFKCKKCGEFYK
jgi:hypothetical protein